MSTDEHKQLVIKARHRLADIFLQPETLSASLLNVKDIIRVMFDELDILKEEIFDDLLTAVKAEDETKTTR